MQITKNIIYFLFVALISSNYCQPSRCSAIVDCDNQSCDPYYQETKQELADEIDDVNDYMQMVADQLTNDDVIVVRAIRTRFTTPDIENTLKPDSLALEAGDFACDQRKDTTSLVTIQLPKADSELLHKDENISAFDTKLKEMKQIYFETEKLPVKMENSTLRNLEAEIIMP